MERIQVEQHSFGGMVWIAGWLFTIGFLQLTFWRGVLSMVLWPYYLGTTFSSWLSFSTSSPSFCLSSSIMAGGGKVERPTPRGRALLTGS